MTHLRDRLNPALQPDARHRNSLVVCYLYRMTDSNPTAQQLTAHALLIGDRINTAGFEGQVLSSNPLALRVGSSGMAVVVRYGVVGFIGLTADGEGGVLERVQ